MKVLVCGGREYDDWDQFSREMYQLYKEADIDGYANKVNFSVVSGDAKGADFLARVWCKFRYLSYQEYKANWKKFGQAAGPIRNQEMLNDSQPDVVIAFPGGKGTADMVSRATKAGVKVIEVT